MDDKNEKSSGKNSNQLNFDFWNFWFYILHDPNQHEPEFPKDNPLQKINQNP
jgi:hypothetical protein